MSDYQHTGADSIIAAARQGMAPTTLNPDEPQIVIVPDGTRPVEVDLSAWRDTPARQTGIYKPATVESFASYVERHADPEVTSIWVHPTSGRIVGIIDDVGVESGGWRQYLAILKLESTPEWDHWEKRDGEMMGQEDFAEHVEIGIDDIVEPDGADVLELAQSFHAQSSSIFRQATKLSSGETQFQYDETVSATAGTTGKLEIPKGLVLGISPFLGEDPFKVFARFRYRINSGKLTLGYKLDRPELIKRQALQDIEGRLRETFPLTYTGEVQGA